MISGGAPIDEATRIVRLPAGPAPDPLELQAQYYNYVSKRMAPLTDVYLGEDLIYRTCALGCRGPGVSPDRPVVAVIGTGAVLGGPDGGGLADRISAEGCQVLNAGIEDLSVTELAEWFEELRGRVDLAAAVIAPPPPAFWEGEPAWRAAMDRFHGLPVMVFTDLGLGDSEDAGRARPWLRTWARKGRRLLAPAAQPASLWDRLHGHRAPDDSVAVLQAALAAAIAAHLAKAPWTPSLHAGRAPQPTGAATDIGRNYPLW
jgi:hypothetical protein